MILSNRAFRAQLELLVVAALAFGSPGFASAAGTGSDIGQLLSPETLQLLVDRRCSEALPALQSARLRAGQSAELALLLGRCQVQTFDYVSAAPVLREARSLDPELPDAALFLAIANYHLEFYPAAREAIGAARGNVSPDARAEFELYAGLLLLQSGEAREAALQLGRSRLTDASKVEPVASYYEGLAWQSVNERARARRAFERVISQDGDGTWGRRAVEALKGARLEDRSWINLRAGLEYDSNVILLGDGLTVPVNLDRQGDGRASWYLNAGTELFRNQTWSGGVAAGYVGTAHFELREFDTQLPVASGWIDRVVSKQGLLRLRYTVGHAWVDYSDFVTLQNARLSWYHDWGRGGSSELWTGWEWNKYHFDIPDIQEGDPAGNCGPPGDPNFPCAPFGTNTAESVVRDGNGLRVGLQHEYSVRALEGDFIRAFLLRGSYAYRLYVAKGDDWDFQSHELLVGFKTLLPWMLELDVEGAFIHQPFANRSSYPPPDAIQGEVYTLDPNPRRDQYWRFEATIERPISDHLSVSADYRYVDAVSNVALFRYDRHLVGVFATLSY